jgi:hypothetical protein
LKLKSRAANQGYQTVRSGYETGICSICRKNWALFYPPQAQIELTLPGEYDCVLEQINVHRWHLGQQKQADVPISDAVASWYDNVYTPLVQSIEELGLAEEFPDRTVSDLYLWVFEYLWYLREAIRDEFDLEQATQQFVSQYSSWPAKRLVDLLEKAAWIEYFILAQERSEF